MEEYNPFGKESSVNQQEQARFPQFGNAGEPKMSHISSSGLDDLQKKIEAAKSNGWGAQAGEFIGKNKKRIGLLAVAVLLFGAGFYAYNKNGQDIPVLNLAAISKNAESEKIDADNAPENEDFLAQALDLRLDENGKLNLEDEPSFVQDSGSVITKSAKSGEGITHLARYAIKDYLEEQGETLTREQKIYAEDYVQNRIGSELLEIGQKLSFPKDLLQEAIEGARGLEEWQIENLQQYTTTVSLL